MRVISRVGSVRAVVATLPVPAGAAVLLVRIMPPPQPHDARTGPDVITLGVEQPDGTFAALAVLDGRYLSTEVAGGFTGRVIGLYATQGTVHADLFEYEPPVRSSPTV